MDLIIKLQEIGLTGREAEIYIAMLQKKEFKAPEIAKITTISRTKIYEVLQNLVNKGVCNGRYENGKKIYSVIEPEIAINNVLSIYQQELIRREKIASILGKQLSLIHKNNSYKDDPLEYIKILKDKGQIQARWLTLQQNAKKEMIGFTKPPYFSPFTEDVNEEANALKRNIKIRSIYEYKDIIKEEFLKVISLWISAGEEARIVEELPLKLLIIDEKITMLALNDPISLKPSMTTMIIDHPSFAKAQKYVFESVWEKAMPFKEFKIKEKL